MILAGGENILYSEELVDTQGPTATKQKIALDIKKPGKLFIKETRPTDIQQHR